MGLTGWVNVVSTLPNGTVDLFLNDQTSYSISLEVRAVVGSQSLSLPNVPVAPQVTTPWSMKTTFVVPGNFDSGYYQVAVPGASLDEAVAGFVVRPLAPAATSKILFSVDMLTNRGYDHGYYSNPRMSRVTFDSDGGLPNTRELRLHKWLEQESIPFECCAAQELTEETLAPYDCLVIAGHCEYWTRGMMEAVTAFIAGGGNLICLSGNTCFRQVRLEDAGRTMVCEKFPGSDTQGGFDASVAFADPPVNRPANRFLGSGWTHGAFRGSSPVAGHYEFRFRDHWTMAGVNVGQTSPFMSYETDAAAWVEEDEGYPRVTGDEGTPATFVPLGTAVLSEWEKPGYATMGIYRRGGIVFTGGTTDWATALLNVPGFVSGPSLQTITRNVFDRLQTRVPADWELIGHANGGTALTAVGRRLFIATTSNQLWRRHPVGAETVWTLVGHANWVVAMASDGDGLYAITQDGQLWWRRPIETDVTWTSIGTAPSGATTLACAGGTLYAFDSNGRLHVRPATKAAANWRTGPANLARGDIVALTAYADVLFAVSASGRLLRSNSDWIFESWQWVDIHHCYFAIGLAVVEGTLFVVTSENKLWMLDLHGLRAP